MKNLSVGVLTILCIGNPAHATSLGLKNFRELPAALTVATGVPLTTPSIQLTLKKVASQLPLKGQVEEMSSPYILAVTELVGDFCQEMITQESAKPAAERLAFRDVDFKVGPKQFVPATKDAVINELSDIFWGRGPTGEEMASLKQSVDEGATGVSTSSTAETTNLMKILCSTFGTSLEFLID